MLAIVSNPQRRKSIIVAGCLMHGPQHARDKLVDAVTFLDKRYKSGNTTFVINSRSEVRKYEFLECLNLVLESHQIGNGVISVACQLKKEKKERKKRKKLESENSETYPSLGSLIVFRLIYSS